MTYAIAHVVYGIVLQDYPEEYAASETAAILTEDAPFKDFKDIVAILEEEQPRGVDDFVVRFFADHSGQTPSVIGVQLCKFRECPYYDVSKLKFSPDANDLVQYAEAYKRVVGHPLATPEFVAYLSTFKPKTIIAWSSS